MPKISTLNASYPTDCETLLQLRSQFADRVYFINKGYICYYFGKYDKPFEHRLVAELTYGSIPDGHHVHHINSKRFDNRASNLELLSPEAHAALHHGDSIVMQCAICNEPMEVPWSRIIRADRVHCSRKCRGLNDRRVEHPTKDQLLDLIETLRNWSAIGRLFGVSDNAVRKWAKRYGINTKLADGRKC